MGHAHGAYLRVVRGGGEGRWGGKAKRREGRGWRFIGIDGGLA